ALVECLRRAPGDFHVESFIQAVVAAARHGQQFGTHTAGADDLSLRLLALFGHGQYDTSRIITEFNGSSYVGHSLPFTYMFFVRNPHSVESLYDCVSAGGDTDSNGSMLAALLGALHGTAVFPRDLVDELPNREVVFDVANRFCDLLDLAARGERS